MSLRSPFLFTLEGADTDFLKNQGVTAEVQLVMKGQALGDFSQIRELLVAIKKEEDGIQEEDIDYMVSFHRQGAGAFLGKLCNLNPENNYIGMFQLAIQKKVKQQVKQQ